MEPQHGSAGTTLNRRRFVQAAVGAVAGAGAVGAARPAAAHADDFEGRSRFATTPPRPIPGGVQLPGGAQIHVWPAFPTDVTLPFSGGTGLGLDVDPSTITDFSGFSAAAFHVGTATGSDGATYNLETDMRAYQGTYVASDGTRRFGTFAFI